MHDGLKLLSLEEWLTFKQDEHVSQKLNTNSGDEHNKLAHFNLT